MNYYGDRISDNMVETPEGYLICKNVPIGRIGWMDYLGEELPANCKASPGQKVKVYRSPEEVFSQRTISSFEGKPATNTHPAENLNLDTAGIISRGHLQNVHRDGDFLVADLFITDAGLKFEIQNNVKREISCGYDCAWIPKDDGTVEQKEIIGNHVAIVQNGRAGPRATIKDEMPEIKNESERGKKMSKWNKDLLAALGLKQMAKDAEPEEIAQAAKSINDDGDDDKKVKDKKVKDDDDDDKSKTKDKKAKDEEPGEGGLTERISKLEEVIKSLVESDKKAHKEVAADAMDELEKELESGEKKAADDDDDKKVKDKKVKDNDDDDGDDKKAKDEEMSEELEKEKEKKAADSAFRKLVKDMKPVIMAIPDEKVRNQVAEKFVSSVRDAKPISNRNGYGDILSTINKNKQKAAMDSQVKHETMETRALKSVEAMNKLGAQMRGEK